MSDNKGRFPLRYPWATMAPGESFVMTCHPKTVVHQVTQANHRYGPSRQFYCEKIGPGQGYRVWRVEPGGLYPRITTSTKHVIVTRQGQLLGSYAITRLITKQALEAARSDHDPVAYLCRMGYLQSANAVRLEVEPIGWFDNVNGAVPPPKYKEDQA